MYLQNVEKPLVHLLLCMYNPCIGLAFLSLYILAKECNLIIGVGIVFSQLSKRQNHVGKMQKARLAEVHWKEHP